MAAAAAAAAVPAEDVDDGREADSTVVEMAGGSRELWLLRLPSAVAHVSTWRE